MSTLDSALYMTLKMNCKQQIQNLPVPAEISTAFDLDLEYIQVSEFLILTSVPQNKLCHRPPLFRFFSVKAKDLCNNNVILFLEQRE
ncbi:MAG TPA: hypothetical protein DFI01_06265 [Bacteroidales bacterium]|nr:hypothetical protein [Bacteroidales bacterium]